MVNKLIAQGLNGFSWPIVLVLLILFYFYSHYLFAVQQHMSAPCMRYSVLQSLRAPPLFSALMLGFFGNLLASTTHYSSGPAPILYALAMLHKSAGGL